MQDFHGYYSIHFPKPSTDLLVKLKHLGEQQKYKGLFLSFVALSCKWGERTELLSTVQYCRVPDFLIVVDHDLLFEIGLAVCM